MKFIIDHRLTELNLLVHRADSYVATIFNFPKAHDEAHGPHKTITSGMALCSFYDDSALYALRYHKHGMSQPVDNQRSDQDPDPLSGCKTLWGSLLQGWFSTFQSTDTGIPRRAMLAWRNPSSDKPMKAFSATSVR